MATSQPILLTYLSQTSINHYTIAGWKVTAQAFDDPSPINPYGFVIQIQTATRGHAPSPDPSYLTTTVTAISHTVHVIRNFLCGYQLPPPLLSERIIPVELRRHLVVITPPSQSPFPLHHALGNRTRVWHSPSYIQTAYHIMVTNGQPEIEVPLHPRKFRGIQPIKIGKVVFIQGEGYYITNEVGPFQETEGNLWYVLMEAHTINDVATILRVPSVYTQAPDYDASWILDREEVNVMKVPIRSLWSDTEEE